MIGADANPYIAMAATLACGLLGIEQRIEPRPECPGDGYRKGTCCRAAWARPSSLLRADHDLGKMLGKEFVTVYTEMKDIEHEEFMKVISPWEREHLLLHV